MHIFFCFERLRQAWGRFWRECIPMIALNAAVTKELHDIITTLIITSTACEDESHVHGSTFFWG